MRILVVHNRYRSELPSGENATVHEQVELLRSAGVEVETYVRDSDEIDGYGFGERVRLAARPIHARGSCRAVADLIRSFRPDVVHLHNPYPLISPSVIRVAKSRGVPVVQTVYNYRFTCSNGLFFRDGRPCTDCLGKTIAWPSVLHACYRGSRAQSTVMATAFAVHRSTWRQIDRFLAVSDFLASQLVAWGVAPSRVVVNPNPIRDPGIPKPLGAGCLFAGRLEREKGIRLLLDAWDQARVPEGNTLTIAGAGPERAAVERAASTDATIRFMGAVPSAMIGELIDGSAVRVAPSLWFEGLPLAIIESFARGRPVIATNLGSSATMVPAEAGWTSDPSAPALARTLEAALADCPGLAARGEAGRALYEERYTPARCVSGLIDVYRQVALDSTRGGAA